MTFSPVERFWNLLSQYRNELRQIYGYAVFIGIVNLTLPLGIQAIINFLQSGQLTTTWIILVGFVLFGIAITGTLQVLQLRVVENIQQDLFAKSAFEFAYRIPQITFVQLDKNHAPELANRFFDTLTIQKGLPKILIDFSLAIFQIVFGLVLLAVYSPYFIILGFAFSLILWLIFQFTGPKGLSTSLVESKYKYGSVHWLEEIARVNRTFKLNTKSDFHLRKMDGIVSGYITSREKHFSVLIKQFKLFVGFKVFVAAGLLVLGGFLVFKEQMNIGQFVAAEIIIILIINSVEKVLRSIDTIYDVLTALEKIGYVTDLKLDKHKGHVALDQTSGLELKAGSIQFGFPSEKQNIFNALSFEVPSGAKVVMTGESGSGKSLLLQILSGIHVIQEGELYINGIPIANLNYDDFGDALGVSFPINQIFEGTFRENIIMGRAVSEKRLIEVLRVLNLTDYIYHQPEGLDCFVDSGGRRLPRSIIQKILIARSIIHKPRLMLLEDPMSFIEDKEKKRIIDYLMAPERDWTLIVVSDFHYWASKSTQVLHLTKNR